MIYECLNQITCLLSCSDMLFSFNLKLYLLTCKTVFSCLVFLIRNVTEHQDYLATNVLTPKTQHCAVFSLHVASKQPDLLSGFLKLLQTFPLNTDDFFTDFFQVFVPENIQRNVFSFLFVCEAI